MKKILLHLLLVFSVINSVAQTITITGLQPSTTSSVGADGTYALVNSPTFTQGWFSGTPLGPKDPGTNHYQKDGFVSGFSIRHFVFRQNNKWYIGGGVVSSFGGGGYLFVLTGTSTAIDPPCSGLWNIANGDGTDTGNPSPTFTISGNCDTPFTASSFTTFPNHVQLPGVSTSMPVTSSSARLYVATAVSSPVNIVDILNPQKGSLTYSSDDRFLRLYDGTAWKKINGSRGDLVLDNEMHLWINNGMRLLPNGNELRLTHNNNTQTLASFEPNSSYIFSKVGINTSSPTSTLQVNGSEAISFLVFTGNLSLNQNHRHVIFEGLSASTISLPNPSSVPGRIYTITNYGTGTLTLSFFIPQSMKASSSGLLDAIVIPADSTISVGAQGNLWYVF